MFTAFPKETMKRPIHNCVSSLTRRVRSLTRHAISTIRLLSQLYTRRTRFGWSFGFREAVFFWCMGFFQQRYVRRHAIYDKPDIHNEIRLFAVLLLPKPDRLRASNFGGFDSDGILELFVREMGQDTTEPFAIASNSTSRSFAARSAVQSCSGAEDAVENVRV
jgi:hypothetical protein